ncbi:MAG: DUF4398 domain-containing protein [Undibacterium sp.]|nr:DUF4398 domain-containing protein [Undibacterium sp.]
MKNIKQKMGLIIGAAYMVVIVGCSSLEAPAKTQIAVSAAAVESASGAGATELAPAEMAMAREKMQRVNAAMNAGDYQLANELATSAQADAKLAQSKANSSKAQAAAQALQDDLRILREELNRKNK